MRLSLSLVALLVATCSAFGQRNTRNDTEAVSRACSVKDCFSKPTSRLRGHRPKPRDRLCRLQRCAFHLELRGTLCDLRLLRSCFPQGERVPTVACRAAAEPASDGRCPTSSTPPKHAPGASRSRICSNDLSIQSMAAADRLESSGPRYCDRFGEPRTDCRVSERRLGDRRSTDRVLRRSRGLSTGATDGTGRNRSRRAGRAGLRHRR